MSDPFHRTTTPAPLIQLHAACRQTAPVMVFGDTHLENIYRHMDAAIAARRDIPLCVVADCIAILEQHRDCPLTQDSLLPESLAHRYRNTFLYPLMYRDRSVAAVHQFLAGKDVSERRDFVPFLISLLVDCIGRRLPLPRGKPAATKLTAEAGYEHLTTQLNDLCNSWSGDRELFTPEQTDLCSYVRREGDIPIVREYSRARQLLRAIDSRDAKKVRSSHAELVEVDDSRSPSMGGIAGIASGGDIEKITSILPSELAMMEKNAGIDLFDINVLERRLLSFVRDHYIDTRRRRSFYMVFFSPESMEYRPLHVPFRWQYFFLTVIFNIISFYRNYFNLRRFPFYFVFPDHHSQAADVYDLIDLAQRRDFPDVHVEKTPLYESTFSGYLRDILSRERADEQSVCCFSRPGRIPELHVPHGTDFLSVTYGGEGTDEIITDYRSRDRRKEYPLRIASPREAGHTINAFRDTVFMGVSGCL